MAQRNMTTDKQALADEKIRGILAKYGEDFDTSIWRVQGTAVIYHNVLERIAAKAFINFPRPKIIRAESDEAVILVFGKSLLTGREEWSIGEAKIALSEHRPGNYRVTGRQAAYTFAMAEKRGKDRVILKLIELHGLVYSEDEADDFSSRGGLGQALGMAPIDVIRQQIKDCGSIQQLTALMTSSETQSGLHKLPVDVRDEIRETAKTKWNELKKESSRIEWATPKRDDQAPLTPPTPPTPPPSPEQHPGESGPEVDEVSLDDLMLDLIERLGFAETPEQVEEGYNDFDAEALMSAYEGGVDRARAAKEARLAELAAKTPASTEPAPRPPEITSGPVVNPDPFKVPESLVSAEAYAAWIRGAIAASTEADHAKNLAASWKESKALRERHGLYAGVELRQTLLREVQDKMDLLES